MPAYRPGQGLSGQAVDRLKARTHAQTGAFALPAQDDSKQWDQLLGGGATKKTRCSVCTRPLGDDRDALGLSVCARCEAAPLVRENIRQKERPSACGRRAVPSRKNNMDRSLVVPVVLDRTPPQRFPMLVNLQDACLIKDPLHDERYNVAVSSVCSTADPEEAEDQSWDCWLDSAVATPEVQPTLQPTNVGSLQEWSLTDQAANAFDDAQSYMSDKLVGETADTLESDDESWDTWLARPYKP